MTKYHAPTSAPRTGLTAGALNWRDIFGNAIEETDLSGNMKEDYIYFNGRKIAQEDPSGNTQYLYPDQVGSTVMMATVSSDGQSATTCGVYPERSRRAATFTPYAEEHPASGNSCSSNYKFTGYERDAETGLDYAFARYYSYRLGRFMSADPLAGRISNPQSLNRYAYVLNNPVSLTDPAGLEPPDGCIYIFQGDYPPILNCPIAGLPPTAGFPPPQESAGGSNGGHGGTDRSLPPCKNLSLNHPGTFWDDSFATPEQVDAFLQTTNTPASWDGWDAAQAFIKEGINPGLAVGILNAENTLGSGGHDINNPYNTFRNNGTVPASSPQQSLAWATGTVTNIENNTFSDDQPLSALEDKNNSLGYQYSATNPDDWLSNVDDGFQKLARFLKLCK